MERGVMVRTSAGESNKDSGGLLRGAVEYEWRRIDRVRSSKSQVSRVESETVIHA